MSGKGRPIQHPELYDAEWLERAYLTNGRTTRDMAAQLDCHVTTVSDRLRHYGISKRTRMHDPVGNIDTSHAGTPKPCTCESPLGNEEDRCVFCGKALPERIAA